MATGDFDAFYPDNPLVNLDQNQRTWYDPLLRDVFRTYNVYSQFATYRVNLGAPVNAPSMVITSLYDLHPDFDPIGYRQMWLPAAHIDSKRVTITFDRFGNKVAYHKFEDLITYWKSGRTTQAQLWASILRGKLGLNVVGVHDYLIRNAYLEGAFAQYAGGASDFATLATDDLFETDLLDEIHLGMQYRDVAYAQDPTGNVGTIICVTTPGVLYDMRRERGEDDDFINVMKYADPSRLLRFETGMFRNVRFICTPKNTLFNCGTLDTQCTVISPIQAGSGAAATVDDVVKPGQAAATNYIQLSDFSAGDFEVNDMVTIHVDRTDDFGVSGGVDYRDGKLHNRRVVSVDATNNRLALDKPVMVDFTTDLTGVGVYAYVSKGRHIHASIFIGAPGGIVVGVGQPPRMYNPPPVDDYESMYRFSWDAYEGFQVYEPTVFETVFSAGSFREKGARVVQ